MAYSSDIDLKIGEIPKTTDPALFPDMVEIYNALHILGQWVNAVQKGAGSGDANTPPWEAMPFRNFFYVQAARDITSGNVVTIVDYEFFGTQNSHYSLAGVINGAYGGGLIANTNPSVSFYSYPRQGSITGLAMSDAAPGELVKVGVGPAIIKMDGIRMGEPVYAYAAYTPKSEPVLFSSDVSFWAEEINDGGLIKLPREGGGFAFKSKPVLVGRGVAPDALMFTPPETTFPDQILNPLINPNNPFP